MIDCHNHLGVELLNYLRGEFPYAQHLETMVREGENLGIERWVVFPMVTHLALDLVKLRGGVIEANSIDESVPYSWENRRMLREIFDLFPDCGVKTIPFAMVDPVRNVPGQMAALRSLREDYPFCGIKIQSTILQSPIRNLLTGGREVLELAEEWNLPMLIHSSVDPADIWAQAVDILEIAEKTPGVRFCLAHSCRFDRECLDRVEVLPNTWFDCSAHCIHCDLATTDSPVVAPPSRRFPTDYSNPAVVLRDLAEAYPDSLMWGSDSPYYSYVAHYADGFLSLRSSYTREVDALRLIEPDLRDRVTQRNTLKYLGMPS